MCKLVDFVVMVLVRMGALLSVAMLVYYKDIEYLALVACFTLLAELIVWGTFSIKEEVND